MKKYKVLLDYGHGGIINGKYQTAPGKMFTFEDGYTIYEGEVNRKIGRVVEDFLKRDNIEYEVISPGELDISLSERVKKANEIYKSNKYCYGISIHSNAASTNTIGKGSNATGFEIWTSPGFTKSDPIAEIFADTYIKRFKDVKFRSDLSDGDKDKEANLYMLTKTNCPFILIENLFYDNRKEAEFLNSPNGQTQIAVCIYLSIKNVQRNQILYIR